MRRILTTLAFAASAAACDPAGGPSGRYVSQQSPPPPPMPMRDAGTSTVATSTTPDAGVLPPGCPEPRLESIRAEVFIESCAKEGCHIAGAEPAEQDLDLSLPAAQLRARLLAPSKQSPSGIPLVTPGEVGGSYLYLKVFLPQPVEGDRMPPDGDPLERCELEAIRDWITSGAAD